MRELRGRLDRLRNTLETWAALSKDEFGKPEDARSGEVKALLADQSEGNEARKAYKKQREKMREAYNALTERHAKAAELQTVKADSTEHDSIRKLIDAAASTANANEKDSDLSDLESALSLIRRADERLDLLEQGGPTVARDKLGQIHTDYQAGLRAFRDRCGQIVSKARAYVQEPENVAYAPALAMIETLIEDTAGVFEKTDLSDEAVRLSGSDPAQQQDRKRAREQVLQKVRAAMATLTQSTAVELMVRNPFGIAAVATAFHRNLRRIELEVLRGV
jgi:hypothetical protein